MGFRGIVTPIIGSIVFSLATLATDMEIDKKFEGQLAEILTLGMYAPNGGPTGDEVKDQFLALQELCHKNPECLCRELLRLLDLVFDVPPHDKGNHHGKMAIPTIFHGQVFVFLVELGNTSQAGGGPFSVNQAQITLDLPPGANLVYPEGVLENGLWIIDVGDIEAHASMPVPIAVAFDGPGIYDIDVQVSTELFDPVASNNQLSQSVQVLAGQKQLLYPWVSNNDQFESIIVVNNYGTEEALIRVEAIRTDGDGRRIQQTIPPRGFLKMTPGELFPTLGQGSGLLVSVISNSTTLSGVWVTNDLTAASGSSPSQGVAIAIEGNMASLPKSRSTPSQDLVFNYLPTGQTAISAPVLINLGNQPSQVTLDFYNQAGARIHRETELLQEMAPLRPFAAVTQSLIPGVQEDVYLRATAAQPLIGVGFVFNQFGEPSIGNGTATNTSGQSANAHWLLPWVSNNNDFESLVLINNLHHEDAEVSLTGRRFNGPEVTVSRTIPAQGFLRAEAGELFPLLGDGSGFAVEIISANPLLTANWVTNNLITPSGSSPSQGVGINLNQDPNGNANASVGQHLVYGFLPLTNGLISGPVVVNVGQQPTAVTLRFYDEMGNLLMEDSTSLSALPPLRPFAAVANTLVGSNTADVYMVASSDGQPLAGVGFAFNDLGEPAIGNARGISFVPDP